MKKEKLFQLDGVYYAIVTHNLLMHDEICEQGTLIFKTLFENTSAKQPVKVLDLACGGTPVSISDMIENVGKTKFEYTGIDINADQVFCASNLFQFSDNTVKSRCIEASAWELESLDLDGPFDVIFTGLNIHHGTPEEIDYLIPQLKNLLSDRGVFINHDWYRPDTEPYVRRPSQNPNNAAESYRIIKKGTLAQHVPPYEQATVEFDGTHHAWRLTFINGLTESYREKTKDDTGAETLKNHMLERDFPVSRKDLAAILEKHGLYFKIMGYEDPGLTIWPFMAMPVATKDQKILDLIVEAVGSGA